MTKKLNKTMINSKIYMFKNLETASLQYNIWDTFLHITLCFQGLTYKRNKRKKKCLQVLYQRVKVYYKYFIMGILMV